MLSQRHYVIWLLSFYLAFVSLVELAKSQEIHKFSVRDDIAMTKFGDVVMSPDESMVVVQIERASLEDGKLHDELQVYDATKLRAFVNASDRTRAVEPLWKVDESTATNGQNETLVTHIRWLHDGTGFAFLLRTDQSHRRLCLALIGSKEVLSLSPEQDNVLGFDIRDRLHYVFTISSRVTREKLKHEREEPFLVGTGRFLSDLMSPAWMENSVYRGDLWAANGGPPVPIEERPTGKPIALYGDGSDALALSPDGTTLVTIRAIDNVPTDWEVRFPAPYPNDAYRLRAGHQDLNTPDGGWAYVGEYVKISLTDGSITSLTNAPAALRAGWWEGSASPVWSDDGSSVFLPGTFVEKLSGEEVRPCALVVRIASQTSECVKPLKRNLANGFEPGYERINAAGFAPGRSDQIQLKNFYDDENGEKIRIYKRSDAGLWLIDDDRTGVQIRPGLTVKVVATFKDPPILVAIDNMTRKTRTVLDPNPQLKYIAFGEPELYAWKDSKGRDWQGVLYKPLGYRSGTKYPLVIQNHGFSAGRYVPSGAFPSAFVAQELASEGIMVLQVRDCAGRSTPLEGPCNVEGYEGAVEKLSIDGLVDPSRIGIIGFSRTVFYVLEALTTSKLKFKAASITDGIDQGYMIYLQDLGPDHSYANDQVGVMGARPFGSGLATWLKSSPDFNLDKVTTPLRVVARGGDALEMWEPYALLNEMNKPVDLILLNTQEHVITDPKIRLAAQGGNVDWFRFWLQGYEDPAPEKKGQYERWQQLKDLRDADFKAAENQGKNDSGR